MAQVNVNMNNLKIRLIIIFLIAGVTSAFSQALIKSTNYNVDGYWGKWEHLYLGLGMTGTYSSFVIHDNRKHPSQYGCKITIYNYNDNISKKEKKRRRKKNEWYTYNGTIEIFLDEHENTTRKWVESFGENFCRFGNYKGAKGSTSATYAAKIMIAPYKKYPQTYNIMFDGYAIGFILY